MQYNNRTFMRLAIIADWLTVFGGAEHTIEQFVKIWPDAPLYATVARQGKLGPLSTKNIQTTALQRQYDLAKNHQILLARMPQAIETIDLDGFDVILSSSHAVAKGVVPPSNAVHVCYCHTPMRYAWEMEEKYLEDFRIPRVVRPYIRKKLKEIRRWDLSTAKRVDVFLANSTETQKRIQETYGRDSVLIPPPVDERFFQKNLIPANERSSYLAVGRLVPYKRFDLLIEAANEKEVPLVIAGTGQDEARLRKLCGPTVTMRGFVPSDELIDLYRQSRAVFFPQYEDAGIVPLEAQACGTPVIAFGKGGSLDSVVDGATGVLFKDQTSASIIDAISHFETMSFDPATIRDHAKKFAEGNFRAAVEREVKSAMEKFGRASLLTRA